MIFLQNLAFGEGYFPKNLNDRINYYLLRSIDGTITSSETSIGIYIKLGPIVFFTTIIPAEMKDMNKITIKKKGIFSTIQHLKNNRLNQFIFIDRPNDVMKHLNVNEKQQKIIKNSYEKNKDKLANSLIMKAILSDRHLKNINRSSSNK